MNDFQEWTRKVPTEPGFYWFYGAKNKNNLNSMRVAKLIQTSIEGVSGLVLIIDGSFAYESEFGNVWGFKKMDTPAIPSAHTHKKLSKNEADPD